MLPRNEWDRCKPLIAKALEHDGGTHWLIDVERGLEAGIYQFWPGKRSAIVTEVIDYPRLKVFNFWLAAGDLQELLEMEPHIVAFAKMAGCTKVRQAGRPGFMKVLEPLGYRGKLLAWTEKEI